MSKYTIVIADTDETYISPLEMKFAEELSAKVELEIITEEVYFNEYFASARNIDMLVISEDLYTSEIQKHDIKSIYVLVENSESAGAEESADSEIRLAVKRVFKYSSISEIYAEITFDSLRNLPSSDSPVHGSTVVMIYSAIGGAGKTTTALGLCACLANNFKRVLYIDAETLQTYFYYLKDKSPLSSSVYSEFRPDNSDLFGRIKHYVRNEKFDYVPPFPSAIFGSDINLDSYNALITSAKASNEYDYIIVDTDSSLNEEKTKLLSLADKAVILVNQDKYSVIKTSALLGSVNLGDKDKYAFVCAKFHSDKPNETLDDGSKDSFVLSEYIEYIDQIDNCDLDGLSKNRGFQKLAYLLL
jgi:cellulose biosynthesis protein BcsQ